MKGLTIDVCEKCHGVWLDHAELDGNSPYPDPDPTILGLSICRLILGYLATLAHRGRRQHVSQRNTTLL
jgi:hypothetical protein